MTNCVGSVRNELEILVMDKNYEQNFINTVKDTSFNSAFMFFISNFDYVKNLNEHVIHIKNFNKLDLNIIETLNIEGVKVLSIGTGVIIEPSKEYYAKILSLLE